MATKIVSHADIYTERAFPSGAWICSAMLPNARVERRYYFFTKAEARADFYRRVNAGDIR